MWIFPFLLSLSLLITGIPVYGGPGSMLVPVITGSGAGVVTVSVSVTERTYEDGIYFSVPPELTLEAQRSLVSAIEPYISDGERVAVKIGMSRRVLDGPSLGGSIAVLLLAGGRENISVTGEVVNGMMLPVGGVTEKLNGLKGVVKRVYVPRRGIVPDIEGLEVVPVGTVGEIVDDLRRRPVR